MAITTIDLPSSSEASDRKKARGKGQTERNGILVKGEEMGIPEASLAGAPLARSRSSSALGTTPLGARAEHAALPPAATS
jgi:hypothetical protein